MITAKKIIIGLGVVAVVGAGFYFMANIPFDNSSVVSNQGAVAPLVENQGNSPSTTTEPAAATTTAVDQVATTTGELAAVVRENKTETVIGKSVQGREIIAYHYGSGEKEILFVGGVHGGYAWNTTLLAYKLMDYIKPPATSAIPSNIKITIIPVLNPDGLNKVVSATEKFSVADVSIDPTVLESGRFNANKIDLNRNFDCGWKATGVWQNKKVSGGTAAFSEPESAAIRDYAQKHKIAAVVAWYSAGGGVYSSSCGGTILPETQTITDIYAKAAGYKAYKNFESYQVSGDMTDWFAKNNVTAISVLLATHTDIDWSKNAAGIGALLEYYAK